MTFEELTNQIREVKNNMMLELSMINGKKEVLINDINKLNEILDSMEKKHG